MQARACVYVCVYVMWYVCVGWGVVCGRVEARFQNHKLIFAIDWKQVIIRPPDVNKICPRWIQGLSRDVKQCECWSGRSQAPSPSPCTYIDLLGQNGGGKRCLLVALLLLLLLLLLLRQRRGSQRGVTRV